MVTTYINSILSLISLRNSVGNSKAINGIQKKLNFITDDLSWIESNNGGQLIKEVTNLKLVYESELQKINSQILDSKLFNQDVSLLVDQLQEVSPEIFEFMLHNDIKIFELISLSSGNIMELYQISESLAIQIEEAISAIGMIALKYGMSIQELSIKVDRNERYILLLSERMINLQAQLAARFTGIKDELSYIQSEVDRQLQDIGLVSSNTTAVILGDGSLKISENLTRYTNRIFVGQTSTKLISGRSTNYVELNTGSPSGMKVISTTQANANKAALSFSTNASGAVSWSHSASSYTNTVKLKNIVPVGDDQGILLDLSTTKDVIIQDINLNQPIFIILKGGGLANINLDSLIPMFRPAMIKRASLSLGKIDTGDIKKTALRRSQFITVDTTVGAAGTFIIPVNNSVTNYAQFLNISIQSKSDNLVILKVSKLNGWSSILSRATEKGGHVSGKTFASMNEIGPIMPTIYSSASASGAVFQPTPPIEIIGKGDLIIRFPVSHLTFHGVEVAY